MELATRVRRQHTEAEAARLAQEQAEHREADDRAKSRYMELQLIGMIDGVVSEINQQLPEVQITRNGGDTSPTYHVAQRELHVRFFRPGEMYERPVAPGRLEYLRNGHAAHGGYIEIHENGEDLEGWNVVLVRPPADMYGTWHIVETDVSPLVGRVARFKPFATQAELFGNNLSCHWMRMMHTYALEEKPLERADIMKIMKVFLPGS